MQQIVVQKANRMGEETWSTRVLTIDAASHVLYLSQRGNIACLHHCMINNKQVNWWPYYSWYFPQYLIPHERCAVHV
jgi:hypothetical protein